MNRGLGAVSWYAVHCTSMNNTNRLLSGDNKGAAEQLLEAWAAPQGSSLRRSASLMDVELPAMVEEPMVEGFVGAFAQSNVGDTSPNTLGAFCLDTGACCSFSRRGASVY
jgi:neutral ceramidase